MKREEKTLQQQQQQQTRETQRQTKEDMAPKDEGGLPPVPVGSLSGSLAMVVVGARTS